MIGRLVALLASFAFLVAACGSAQATPTPTASSGQATPTVAPSGSARPTSALVPGPTQHVIAEVLTLDAPASWHLEKGLLNPGGSIAFEFLGPQELPSQCKPVSQGTECFPWPIMQLEPGSIVVAVRLNGMPGSTPPTGGEPMTVSGQPARWIRGLANQQCETIGGSISDQIVIPERPSGSGWLSLEGCINGPDTTAAESTFSIIVKTLKLVP